MAELESAEAVITLDTAGHYVDANAAALELLGVSLAELRASAPDRFAVRPATDGERAASRARLEAADAPRLVGTAGLRRPDGTTTRVAYVVESADAGLQARIWQVEGLPEAPPTILTVDDVLRNWRAAERALTALAPGTAEWARLVSEIDVLRVQYQEIFKAVEPASSNPVPPLDP